MPLTPGTRLGPYEIVAPLGAGGMGEVHRARDTRLGRDVAIKTLPADVAADPGRRARFEIEAKAVAALSHPNVLAIHDLGAEGDTVFAVMELVEGATLRELLTAGPLSSGRAVPLAIQIANGLAAAHDRGIVHRDLKPENVIVTPDGRAKILDFGLARMVIAEGSGSHSLAPTVAAVTEAGVVLGTVGYMSPEQVRGQAADARSDLFALGAVLYEMLSGRRAFRGDSPADVMSAILREDPAELATFISEISPGLDRIVRRCLEKTPVSRFRSAADLAFALEAVSSPGSSGVKSGAMAALAAAPAARPTFRRLTFRNGHVTGARFTPDGAGFVYGAAWDGAPHEIFSSRIGSPEARHLGLPQGCLLSMSAGGEMAVSLGYRHSYWLQVMGTLARVPLSGGGVRPLQKDVGHADWSPDGRNMAVIRYRDGHCLLEYPPGRILIDVPEWLGFCRVSPDGRRVAFSRHHRSGEGESDLCVADESAEVRTLVLHAVNLTGIAWSPDGREIWWSGLDAALEHGVWATTLEGRTRELYASPVRLSLCDVRSDGRALIAFDDLRTGLSSGGPEGEREIDLSWFDASLVTDISPDGRQVLFVEAAEAENPYYACYIRGIDGSPAVRLTTGSVSRFSADGEWVITVATHPEPGLLLHPVGFGEARMIDTTGIDPVEWAGFHPDGKRLFVVGGRAGRPRRLHLVPVAGGEPQLLWDEEIDFDRFMGPAISPDGDRIVLRSAAGGYVSRSISSGHLDPIPGLLPGQAPIRFDASGNTLYVTGGPGNSRAIERLDLASGARTHWRTIEPAHPLGVLFLSPPIVTADGRRHAYSYGRVISSLYLVEGLGG